VRAAFALSLVSGSWRGLFEPPRHQEHQVQTRGKGSLAFDPGNTGPLLVSLVTWWFRTNWLSRSFRSPPETCPVPLSRWANRSIPRVWALPPGGWVNDFAGQLPIETKCPDPPDRVSPAAGAWHDGKSSVNIDPPIPVVIDRTEFWSGLLLCPIETVSRPTAVSRPIRRNPVGGPSPRSRRRPTVVSRRTNSVCPRRQSPPWQTLQICPVPCPAPNPSGCRGSFLPIEKRILTTSRFEISSREVFPAGTRASIQSRDFTLARYSGRRPG
jgi:hypothetical protein